MQLNLHCFKDIFVWTCTEYIYNILYLYIFHHCLLTDKTNCYYILSYTQFICTA